MKHDSEDPFGWPPSDAASSAHGVPDESPAEAGLAPPPAPAGALVPPPKVPGTALAAPAVPPLPPRGRVPLRSERRLVIGSFDLLATIDRVLDTLDVVGDTIAHATGIRARNG